MGAFLLVGGVFGSTFGVGIFTLLKSLGHIDLIISLCYVFFLTWVGSLMAYESLNAYFQWKEAPKPNPDAPSWRKGLPWQVYFPRSRLQLSAWLPLGIGCGVG